MSLLQITHGYSGVSSNSMETRIAFFAGKGCNSFNTGGANFYEISAFLKPVTG
jgi:hypothetical protein